MTKSNEKLKGNEDTTLVISKINQISDRTCLQFNHIKENLEDIKNHLKELNGQTEENTKFRYEQTTRNKIVYGIITFIAGVSATALIAVFA